MLNNNQNQILKKKSYQNNNQNQIHKIHIKVISKFARHKLNKSNFTQKEQNELSTKTRPNLKELNTETNKQIIAIQNNNQTI